MPRPELLLDEDVSIALAGHLAALGFDVVTAKQLRLDNRKTTDQEMLAAAHAAGRALVTHNHAHFRRLHRSFGLHLGIISCTRDRDLQALAHRIAERLSALDDCRGQYVRVVRPT